MDLDALSLDELRDLRGNVDRAIVSFEKRKRREAQAAAEEAARKHGFSLAELTGTKPIRGLRSASASGQGPRYANPDNRNQTWSGRGRRPSWFRAHLEAGRDPENMAI